MHRLLKVFALSVLALLIAWPTAHAANAPGSSVKWQDAPPEVIDSLKYTKYSEPSLQQVLNNLGYNIDVVNDRLPTEVWVSIANQYSEVMLAEIAGYAPQTASGWYGQGAPADTHVIFRGPDTPPDSAFFYITGVDSNGLFMAPYAGDKCEYVFYSEQSLNPDHKDHAWVFCSKKRPNEFIVAWEDYYDLGDADYNDLVLLYRLPNRPPVLYVPNDTALFKCQPESICFDNIRATDPDYCGETVTITKIAGPGVYNAGECCFLPGAVDSTYQFIFKATDWYGATDIDTVRISVHMNHLPTISVPEAETVWVENTLIFHVTAADADPLDILTLTKTGPGIFSYTPGVSPITGTLSWTPAKGDTLGSPYTVIFQVSDNCCGKGGITDTCTIIVLSNNPPQVNCPNTQNHHINGNYTVSQITADDDNQIASLSAYFTGSGVANLILTNIQGLGTNHATANVNYDVTNHCAAGGFVWVIAVDNFGAADTCFFGINMSNSPPVLTCPANDSVQAGNKLTSGNYSVTDPDADTAPVTLLSIIPSATNNPTIVGSHVEWNTTCAEKGDYTIKLLATDPCGAKDTCQFTVKVYNQPPVLTCTGDELTCDSTLASAIVTSNPSTGVTYLWTPAPVSGQGTAHARYNAPGNKKVVVTIIANSCRKDSCEAVITQNVTKPVLSCSGDELTCDSTLASAIVTSNPSVGVSYLWTPAPVSGQGTAHARYDAPGTKKVVVTITATGCKDSCEAVITQTTTKPVLNCSGDELTCDSLLASAIVTSNPSTGVTYLWSPAPVTGQGTAHARYDTPGTKKVVVTIAATGCKDSCDAIITQTTTKPVLNCSGDELTCDSLLASAIVTSNPSVGVSYLWTPAPVSGQGTAHARYDAPGNKKVVVTITATGCKDSCEAVITQNVTKPVLSCSGDELTCDSTLASAIVTSNPSVGVSYLWAPAPVSGQGNAHARYDAPGTKWVVVTINATGCKDSCNAVITQTAVKPVLSCSGDELTCDSTLASAIVTSNPSVGVSYLWAPAPVSGQGTAHARYDAPGTKWVVVTINATGCKDSCNAVITQTAVKPVLSCSGDELTCDNTLASAIVTSNPSVGVSYLWTPAPVSGQGTAHARYDAPGNKKVVVTITATGCKDSCEAVITQNVTKPVLSCSGDELTCDSTLASAIVTSNPSTGVTYLWTPAPVSGQGTAHARYDAPGNKKVVVTITATGCKDSCEAVITQNVTKPVLSCSGDELTCDSTLASAIVTSNPSTGVTYLWTPAPVSGQGTAHARYDAPGTKWVVVTINATGCKDSCNAVITQNVTKPVLSCSGDELTCDSTLASAIVTSNPSTGVTYLWTPAPVSGQGTAHARYDAPGTKWVVVTINATGCKDSCNAVITQTAVKPVLSCSGDELTCDSTLASAIVTSNPSVGVSYLWTPAPVSGQGTAHARYDAPGTKWVVVTINATGCKDSCNAVITQNVTKPVLSCSGDELTCDSTLASAIVTSNPSVGVSYLWTPAPVSGQGTAHARYDAPGTKWVVVTINATGCKDSCNAVITQNVTKPVLSCSGDELTCDSLLASAIVTSNPSTGVTYLWTPAPVSGQGTAHARYDAPGNKKVVVTITATGCKDSCEAVITRNLIPPSITCPDSMIVHNGHQSSGNFTVTQPLGDSIVQVIAWVIPTGTGITNLTVSGGTGRTPTTGHVEFDVNCSYPGLYIISLEATDKCGLKDTCEFTVNIYNHPPQITCPINGTVDAGLLFGSTNFAITDQDGDQMTTTIVSIVPPAVHNPTIAGNHVEWLTTAGESGNYIITLRVTDACGLTDECSFLVTVRGGPCGEDKTHVWIEEVDSCVNPGEYATIPIWLANITAPFGGFEIEVEFDYTSMTFISAEPGPMIGGFEYFTYRLLPCPSCACCKYKILLYGMYDIPNGSGNVGTPIPVGTGVLVYLNFVVNNDENLRGLMIPVCFEWEGTVVNNVLIEDWDCNENTFSSVSGDTLFTSSMLCQFRADLCDAPTGGIQPVLVFQDCVCGDNCGGILVCPAGPSQCKRGDVNYNTLPYEVADAVLFARYFAEGAVVFTDPTYQICATDVNADGRTLTLSDLVYLIRVILHDAVEIPKLAPSTIANVVVYNGVITVEGANVGAILFEFDGAVNPTLLAANMEMVNKDNKVLVWSRTGNSIENAAEVLSYTGDAKLTSVTAVDRDTRVLTTTITSKVAPTTFALHQAYPNPFNPFTNLSFTLPEAANYSLKIYNVAGQLVRAYEGTGSTGLNVITWDGKDNSGNSVSSGVYFYKLTCGKFSATEKMVMMK